MRVEVLGDGKGLSVTTQQRIMQPPCSIGRAVASAAFEDFVSAS
jgi:hypothetical protein